MGCANQLPNGDGDSPIGFKANCEGPTEFRHRLINLGIVQCMAAILPNLGCVQYAQLAHSMEQRSRLQRGWINAALSGKACDASAKGLYFVQLRLYHGEKQGVTACCQLSQRHAQR